MMASGVDNSAKMSAYLSCGCVSPRTIHKAVLAADTARGALPGEGPGSTLLLHLMIRCCPPAACRHMCAEVSDEVRDDLIGTRLVSQVELSLFLASLLNPPTTARMFILPLFHVPLLLRCPPLFQCL